MSESEFIRSSTDFVTNTVSNNNTTGITRLGLALTVCEQS